MAAKRRMDDGDGGSSPRVPFQLVPTPLDNTETPCRGRGGQKLGGNSNDLGWRWWRRRRRKGPNGPPKDRNFHSPFLSPPLLKKRERDRALLAEKKFQLPVKSLRCYEEGLIFVPAGNCRHSVTKTYVESFRS